MGRPFRDRVTFHAGDVREYEPRREEYDLIVTNFFLDCFAEQELAQVVARLAGNAAPQARWIVSDFREAEGTLGRLWTWAVIRALYAGFRMTTGLRVNRLPDYAAALARRGFLLRCEETALGGLLFSSLWEGLAARPALAHPSGVLEMAGR